MRANYEISLSEKESLNFADALERAGMDIDIVAESLSGTNFLNSF
jgi:hypothetical protein